jgi:hypothetical protein
MDVKYVFMNEDLQEEVYMHQPHGFTNPSSIGKGTHHAEKGLIWAQAGTKGLECRA